MSEKCQQQNNNNINNNNNNYSDYPLTCRCTKERKNITMRKVGILKNKCFHSKQPELST